MGTVKGGRKKTPRAGAAKKPVAPKTTAVSFQWAVTDATSVSVVGDFNKWNPHAHPLRKGKNGAWKVTLRLKPGRYEYMFIVDGEWRDDPVNPNRVPNPHGGFNSVCEVG